MFTAKEAQFFLTSVDYNKITLVFKYWVNFRKIIQRIQVNASEVNAFFFQFNGVKKLATKSVKKAISR